MRELREALAQHTLRRGPRAIRGLAEGLGLAMRAKLFGEAA
jgi:hypothetical protein